MRRISIPRAGGYERLSVEEAPDPTAGPGEILIDVAAAGVNYADCVVRMGLYQSARDYVGWPITPGFEIAGTVAALGEGVSGPALGTPVMAVTLFGGYSSRLAVPAHQVFPIPPGMDAAQAAGFPTVFLTAYYAVFEMARPRPGSRVLVHSAAGGVGSALVRLCRIAECDVVGVVGAPHKVEAVPADLVIDKSSTDLWEAAENHAPGGYDAIFDANGVETLRRSYRHVAPAGRLVVYGFHTMMPKGAGRVRWLPLIWNYLRTPRFDPVKMTNDNRSVLAFNLSYLFDRKDLLAEAMGRLLGWNLDPLPVTRFPLDRVADAHRALESGATVGKLVLEM